MASFSLSLRNEAVRTYPDVEALLPAVGQGDLGVELDGEALAVVAALVAVLVPDTATEAAVEGDVAERGGDHLDVGSGSHQGRAPAASGCRTDSGKGEEKGSEVGERGVSFCSRSGVVCAVGRARDKTRGLESTIYIFFIFNSHSLLTLFLPLVLFSFSFRSFSSTFLQSGRVCKPTDTSNSGSNRPCACKNVCLVGCAGPLIFTSHSDA